MTIVTVKNKYQVVIPRSVRDEVGVNVGDVLEAKVEKGKITFTPKALVDRKLAGALTALRENARQKGASRLTMRQINAEIAAYRLEQRAKTTNQRSRK